MSKDINDKHTQDWLIPFGGSKFDYQQHKTVNPEPKTKTIEEELGISAFGRTVKKESV